MLRFGSASGASCWRMDRPDLAASELRAAIDADPDDYRAYVALGVALDLSCDQRQAQQVYRDGLRHDPGNLSLRNNLALSLAFSGDNGEAIDMLSELSRELGAGPRVRQNLALVYSLAGRPQDAAAIAQRDFTGARLRHNLALYDSLRGVNGPRLAADVVCGGGRGAPCTAPPVAIKSPRTAVRWPKPTGGRLSPRVLPTRRR